MSKQMKYKHKRALLGYSFITPWLIGFLLFFAVPMVGSFIMSLNNLSYEQGILKYDFKGFENFIYAFTGDEKFLPYLSECLLDLVIDVPLILICSFFFALIL